MNWIDIKDKKPQGPGFIIAIIGGRIELGCPVEDVTIVILQSDDLDARDTTNWYSLDRGCGVYYTDENHEDANYWNTIRYWMYWYDFKFPQALYASSVSGEEKCYEVIKSILNSKFDVRINDELKKGLRYEELDEENKANILRRLLNLK